MDLDCVKEVLERGTIKTLYTMNKGISKIPRNFSWVVDNNICAMGFPCYKENIQYLLDNNVQYLISLTAEIQPPVTDFQELKYLSCKVEDFTPPTIRQIEECLHFMEEANENGKAAGIHCAHGKGRTGTVLACYLIKHYGMTAHRAVSQIRIHRPGSIETSEQEKTVYLYEQNICSAASLLQD